MEAWGLRDRRSVEKVVGRTVAPSREAVIGALDNCYDPCCRERRISVVDMGLIESVEIRDREVRIEMVLTTGWCPFAARLLEMAEEYLKEWSTEEISRMVFDESDTDMLVAMPLPLTDLFHDGLSP